MPSEFGDYIDEKRRGRAPGGTDILLKDIAAAMGTTATYLSDIVKGRRNPPDMPMLSKIASALHLSDDETKELYDLAGRERNGVAPDLPGYLMDKHIPHVRAALRRANEKKLGDDFWRRVYDDIDKEGE